MGDIPSNPTDRDKLKTMIVEMTNCLERIDAEREQMKEIADAAEKTFDIKKKFLNKMARTMFKHNYSDLQTENEHFELLYETVCEGRKT